MTGGATRGVGAGLLPWLPGALVGVQAVAVKELENRLSSYLREVRDGETSW